MSWQYRVGKISKFLSFLMVLCGVLGVYLAYAYALYPSASLLKEAVSMQPIEEFVVGLLGNEGLLLFGMITCFLINCAFYALLAFSGNLESFDSKGKIIAKIIFKVIFFVAVSVVLAKVTDAFVADNPIVFLVCLVAGLPFLLALRLLLGLVKKAGKNTFREYVPSSGASSAGSTVEESEVEDKPKKNPNVQKQISKNAYISKDYLVYVNCFYDGDHLRNIDDPHFIVYLEEFSRANAKRYGITQTIDLRGEHKIVDAEGEIRYYDGTWFTDAAGNRCSIKGRI